MRVLVLGGTGMLGHKLVQTFDRSFDTWASVRGRFSDMPETGIFTREKTVEGVDVRDLDLLRITIENVRPDVVVNAIGVTKQVPAATDMVELITLNSVLPHALAGFASEFGFRLICISTDCVFSGRKGNYTEADFADAEDVYGQSKRLGEVTSDNSLTIRTSMVGRELRGSHGLVEWFLSNRGKRVSGFTNAIFSGFPTLVLAKIISEVIERHHSLKGVYHISSEPISKFDLLNLVNDAYGAKVGIEADASFAVDRSLDSTLFRRLTGFKPDSWPQMVNAMAGDPFPYDRVRTAETSSK